MYDGKVECCAVRCEVEFVVFIIYNRAGVAQVSGGCIGIYNFLL